MSEQEKQTGAGDPAPVCPRHPGVVSYVRCQRCGRPVCPQCQRPAAVGVQCVDCVRESAQGRPTVRTTFGGRARGPRPTVTITIIAVAVVVYLVQAVAGGAVLNRLAFAPALGWAQPYRFLSAAFLHGGALHLAVNMYALWIVGSVLEPVLGRWRYIALYVLSAVGGSTAVLLFADPAGLSWVVPVVGASGAVFGLFSAIFVVLRRLGRDATQILVLIGVNFALGFVIANISWQAHLGGALTGALLATAFAYAPRERRGLVGALAVVLVALVLGVAVVARYAAV